VLLPHPAEILDYYLGGVGLLAEECKNLQRGFEIGVQSCLPVVVLKSFLIF